MLSRIARNQHVLRQLPRLGQACVLPVVLKSSVRHLATSSDPKEVFTKITDQNDPQRAQFFKYSWGSWLKNDKLNKQKRETSFSIEGLLLYLDTISQFENGLAAPKPIHGSFVLSQNIDLLGKHEDKVKLKSIASIHEGKHHHIYLVSLNTGKELVLRIPYKLESDSAIAAKIKSEVATLDFLNLKLGLKVPRVVSYGADSYNEVGTPYILQEYIPGDLLMKKWHPLNPDSEETNKALHEVIDPIAQFNDKVLSVTFNKFGSLYFYDDVEGVLQNDLPYDGETNEALKKRWRIGPSVEKQFTKNKEKMSQSIIDQLNGPWDASNPTALMESVADIELENARSKLALLNSDLNANENDKDLVQKQIATFENLKKITPQLINTKSTSIMNVEELFKPRLYIPDLDPLNVVQKGTNDYYFVDFEGSTIKPFILSSYPKFVSYQGAKIYNLEEDIPGYNELDEVEKQQYQFMYYKTRNERIWEVKLNENRHDLIAVASPHIKVIKSPYLQALDLKNDKDYLYVEGSIVQLQAMWEAYVANELVNSKDTKFPIEYTPEYLDQHQEELSNHQLETVSTPFSATGGWIPQDMFDTLKNQGIIVETKDGDYKIETEKVLENPPKPEDKN